MAQSQALAQVLHQRRLGGSRVGRVRRALEHGERLAVGREGGRDGDGFELEGLDEGGEPELVVLDCFGCFGGAVGSWLVFAVGVGGDWRGGKWETEVGRRW